MTSLNPTLDGQHTGPLMSGPETIGHRESARRRFLRRLFSSWATVISLGILLLVILLAVAAPWIAPHDPSAQDLRAVLEGPSADHWLGTDELGRDVLSRLLYGARVTLVAGLQATSISLVLGVPVGMVAGYFGGRLDRAVMTVNDGVMSLPGIVLAIAIVGALGPSLTNAMTAVGIVYAPRVVRVVRAETLAIRQEPYVEASQTIGLPTRRILSRHVLPNIRSTVIVYATLLAARAMLAEASLSFLGLGAQFPDASWGAMLGRYFEQMSRAPYLVFVPGLCIAIVVLALNLLGDGLRDATGREVKV